MRIKYAFASSSTYHAYGTVGSNLVGQVFYYHLPSRLNDQEAGFLHGTGCFVGFDSQTTLLLSSPHADVGLVCLLVLSHYHRLYACPMTFSGPVVRHRACTWELASSPRCDTAYACCCMFINALPAFAELDKCLDEIDIHQGLLIPRQCTFCGSTLCRRYYVLLSTSSVLPTLRYLLPGCDH